MAEGAVNAQLVEQAPPRGAPLLSYIEDMLLELAHMASAGGEAGLAASLAIAAIQAGARLKQAEG